MCAPCPGARSPSTLTGRHLQSVRELEEPPRLPPGGTPACLTLYADLPVHSDRPWGPDQIGIFLRTPEFGTETGVFVCCKEDYSDVILLVVGEEICLLLLIVQTRKVTSDMCDLPPQFARHTSALQPCSSANSSGTGGSRCHCPPPPPAPLSAPTPCVTCELLNLNNLVLKIVSVNSV